MSDVAFKVLIGNGYDDILFKTIMLKGEKGDRGEAGGAEIDDSSTALTTTWSSSKINSEFNALPKNFSELGDVSITAPSDDQAPLYDATAGKWKNKTVDASTLKYNSVKSIKDEIDAKASNLTELDDVAISSPQSNQGLIYNSTTGKWGNGTVAVSGNLDDLADVDIDSASLADGEALKWNATAQKWENGAVSTTTALANLTDVSLDSSIPDSSSLVYNATEGKWENEQLDATNLPISSSDPMNTKDYIDGKLTYETDDYSVATYGGTIRCKKWGRMVNIQGYSIGTTLAVPTGAAYTFTTIASKYRPSVQQHFMGFANSGSYKYDAGQGYRIDTDGKVIVYVYAGTTFNNGTFNITYIV